VRPKISRLESVKERIIMIEVLNAKAVYNCIDYGLSGKYIYPIMNPVLHSCIDPYDGRRSKLGLKLGRPLV
jgi:hypothetical protein